MEDKLEIDDMEKSAQEVCDLLGAMSNPKRLMILCHLLDGEISVNELAKLVVLNQAALSQHLAKLRSLGLVQTRREAQHIYYAIASNEVYEVLALLNQLYCKKNGKSKC